MKILIATMKYIRKENFAEFRMQVDKIASTMRVAVTKIAIHSGPDGLNIALETVGEDWKTLANVLTYNLMPSRWTITDDEITEGYFV